MRHVVLGLALIATAIPAEQAFAQEAEAADAFVRVGASRIRLVDKGEIFADGVRDPAADYKTPERYVASVEVGYFVLDQVSVQFAGTTPTETSNVPAGSLDGLPNLGNDEFSIFTLSANFHPLRGGGISPYVGGGVALQKVWDVEDRLAQNMDVHDAFGPLIQGGVEVAVGDRFGLFFDVKKAFYTANASGDLGPTRITAKAQLDPLLLQAGALIRF